MRTIVDDLLRAETARHGLRYRCTDCAHFVVETRGCAEGFPNEGHRDRSVERDEILEFCKSFELA